MMKHANKCMAELTTKENNCRTSFHVRLAELKNTSFS